MLGVVVGKALLEAPYLEPVASTVPFFKNGVICRKELFYEEKKSDNLCYYRLLCPVFFELYRITFSEGRGARDPY